MGNDVFGIACNEYLNNKNSKMEILVKSNIVDDDTFPVSYLFRSFEQMPRLEQLALSMVNGDILDIGACAGSHSLFLAELGNNVTSLDISSGCCDVMRLRGLKKVLNEDIFSYRGLMYDNILLLMNGIGIAGNIDKLEKLFLHLKHLLKPNGKIVFDSSDLQYLYMDDDGSLNVPLLDKYYGEIEYQLQYKNFKSNKFSWLFADPFTVENIAEKCGLKMNFIEEGEHFDYLATLTL